jgi:hypothetical protein
MARPCAKDCDMIPANDANTGRIIRLCAQILRAFKHKTRAVLLKALFNDNRLIFARNYGHSAGYSRAQRGLEL